jgi:NAD(P)-dependent dehydrogenase (short-subunit alcohol dehydrogenase family)
VNVTLAGKTAIITGAASGIGLATVQSYLESDAAGVVAVDLAADPPSPLRHNRVRYVGGDVGVEATAVEFTRVALEAFGRIDVLVNNAAEQHLVEKLEDLMDAQLERTFRTNIFGQFFLTRAALPEMPEGAAIINTASVTAYHGNPQLLDYASTKGAIVAFTRSLSKQLEKRKIRVNAVAPGPIWTPLIPASYPAEKSAKHGTQTPMGRAGEPDDVAPSYIFLASRDAAYFSGQVLHPNGGEVVNG